MDLQSESDPQPSGKINKAAFKLFGKRKPGSPVSSIFSIRGKGEGGKGAAKAPLVRSNTHDGIMETPAEPEGRKKEESTGGGQPCAANEAVPAVSPRTSFSSITSLKSLGFLTLLRPRGRAGEGEPRPGARRRRGLKGLFGGVRWHRKDQGAREEREEREEPAPPPALLLASRSNSVEIVKEHMTLTPRPPPRAADAQAPPTPEPDEDVGMPATMDDGSPLMEMAGDQWNKIFFPYSALGPKGTPAPTATCTTETGDKVNGTSSRTEDSRGEKEGTGRWGTDRAPDGDGLQGKVAEEKACPALASIPKGTPAPAPLLKPSYLSPSFSATSAPSPGSGATLPPASKPAPTPTPASIPKPTPPIASATSTPAPGLVIGRISIPVHDPTPLPAYNSSPVPVPVHKPTPAPTRMATSTSPPAQRPGLPPTYTPIPTPTPTPILRPSLPPTYTPTPTPTPTPVPILRPSLPPTYTPIPTPTPTPVPTLRPSLPPTYTPIPTPTPTPVPTLRPSLPPTYTPIPTPTPTPVPTLRPSQPPGQTSIPVHPATPTPVPTLRPSQPPVQTSIPVHPATATPPQAHTRAPPPAHTPAPPPAHTPAPPPAHTPTPSPTHTPSPVSTPAMSPVPAHMPSPAPTPASGYVPVSDAAHPPGLKPTATSTKATVSMDTDEDTTGQDEVSGEDITCRNREEEEEFSSREKVLGRAATCAKNGKELVKQDGVAGGASGPTIGGRKPSSHDEEDVKAQIQGLQRAALQREEGLPASPPSLQSGARRPEKRPPPVKALGLSKIPVSGCARAGKQPREDGQSKDMQDIPPNYDEGYWDSPTPGLEEEGASFLAQEEEESPGTVATGDNTTTPVSTHEPKLTPSSLGSGRPLKGNSSLPRDSKIPVKQPVSHTVSHGTATSATTPPSHTHGTKAEATRTKIPVSKVPVRRTSARSAPLHDLPRK